MSWLQTLKRRHSGSRCVNIANGRTVTKMDLYFLRQEVSIGLNKIYFGFKEFHFYPKNNASLNKIVVEHSNDEIRAINYVKITGDQSRRDYRSEDVLTFFVNAISPSARVCKDISRRVHHDGTVTNITFQIDCYLGFKQVKLISLDHPSEYQGQPNEVGKQEGPETNQFFLTYFIGQNRDNPAPLHSEASYRPTRTINEENKREVINIIVGGACQIFEKADKENCSS